MVVEPFPGPAVLVDETPAISDDRRIRWRGPVFDESRGMGIEAQISIRHGADAATVIDQHTIREEVQRLSSNAQRDRGDVRLQVAWRRFMDEGRFASQQCACPGVVLAIAYRSCGLDMPDARAPGHAVGGIMQGLIKLLG